MNFKLILTAATAVALLGACGTPSNVRTDPTYDEAAASKFVALNKDAISKLVADFCGTPSNVRTDPTYGEAGANPTYGEAGPNKFVPLNKNAISKLVADFPCGDSPVLVATVVNVNDMRRTAPLGRTLSEQYASQMATVGFNVKEMKLRGDVFIREETGELLLSREIKDIARSHNAYMVLVGTYSAAANFTYVSLKFVRTEDSRIIRAYDYALPNDKDVTKLLQVANVIAR